jgi:hypothetical protein
VIPFTRCFPHVVHLACQAILKAITDMDFADSDATPFEPSGNVATTFMDAIDRDPMSEKSLLPGIRIFWKICPYQVVRLEGAIFFSVMYLFQISGNIRSNEQYQPDGTIF